MHHDLLEKYAFATASYPRDGNNLITAGDLDYIIQQISTLT
jgi:hypothetical protein